MAIVLALIGLGGVPLRDWDEALVARVSLEISRRPWPDNLLPTYLGSSYLNKPPGLHMVIAAAIAMWRWLNGAGPEVLPPERIVRLIPALGSSLLVPLLGMVQAKLRPGRPDIAVATALITLTLLPLARHGRLAMLDGSQLTAMALVWLGVLMAASGQRRALVGGLLAGTGGSMLLLLKAPVALPVMGVALLLRAVERDLDRHAWGWLLLGVISGLGPGLLWHGCHLAARGSDALVMWGAQGLARLVEEVDGNGGGPLVPVLQVLSGGWPWLPLLPFAMARAWRERHSRAGLWTMGLSLQAALLVFPLRTQLPWYHLLLWPPFALACAPVLADLASGSRHRGLARRLGFLWAGLGGVLLLGAVLALLVLSPQLPEGLAPILLPAAIGLVAGGLVMARCCDPARLPSAMATVSAGWLLSLALLFASPLWNWELNNQASLGPVLELARIPDDLRQHAPLTMLREDAESQRPSVHWYLDSGFSPLERDHDFWPQQRFLLLTRSDRAVTEAAERCQLDQVGSEGWKRWLCRAQLKQSESNAD
jgi:4-amino-4-deoxy-L-arabinose transferase-like glycosyltransferase